MKIELFFASIVSLFLLASCSYTPTIEEVQEGVAEEVESLLTEDNNEDTYFRLERFFLNENPEPLVYTGVLKTTYYYKNPLGKWDPRRMQWLATQDSTKLYRDVMVRFRDKKYEHYTIEISAPNK